MFIIVLTYCICVFCGRLNIFEVVVIKFEGFWILWMVGGRGFGWKMDGRWMGDGWVMGRRWVGGYGVAGGR